MASQPPISSNAPSLSSYIKSLRDITATNAVEHLLSLLKRRQIRGSHATALATTRAFLKVVSRNKAASPADLLDHIRSIGARLSSAAPAELAVSNISSRVLGLIREAIVTSTTESAAAPRATAAKAAKGDDDDVEDEDEDEDDEEDSTPAGAAGDTSTIPEVSSKTTMRKIRQDVLEGLREMLDELDQASEQIATYAVDHVGAGELVLTLGSSATVQRFLLAAAKRRRFTVLMAEAYPDHAATHDAAANGARDGADGADGGAPADGARLKTLKAAGVDVMIIPDAAVFALMSRVNKVVLSAQAVLRDGRFVGKAGSSIVAQAAKAHGVPVVVLAAVYKFSPISPFEVDDITIRGDPGQVMPYSDGEMVENVHVVNPELDVVDAAYVDLFISNIGGHAPAFASNVVADHYKPEDTDLDGSL